MSTSSHPSPSDPWTAWQRFLGALDLDGRDTLGDLQRDALLQGDEALEGRQPHELLALQAARGTDTAVRLLRLQEQVWSRWFALLAEGWREAEALGAMMLQFWWAGPDRPAATSDTLGVCLDALQHDLEASAALAGAEPAQAQRSSHGPDMRR